MVSEQPQRRSDTWMETTPHTGGPPRSETTGAGASAARPQSSSSPDIGATAQNIAQQTQETAGHVLDQAKEQATSRLTMQKDRAVESLGTVVEALRQTSKQLHQSDQHGIAQYADEAAERVEQFSHDLQYKDVRTLMRDVENYAREQPALFLGGAFILGLAAARFLKSSAQSGDENTMSRSGNGMRSYGTSYGNRPGNTYGGYSGGNTQTGQYRAFDSGERNRSTGGREMH